MTAARSVAWRCPVCRATGTVDVRTGADAAETAAFIAAKHSIVQPTCTGTPAAGPFLSETVEAVERVRREMVASLVGVARSKTRPVRERLKALRAALRAGADPDEIEALLPRRERIRDGALQLECDRLQSAIWKRRGEEKRVRSAYKRTKKRYALGNNPDRSGPKGAKKHRNARHLPGNSPADSRQQRDSAPRRA